MITRKAAPALAAGLRLCCAPCCGNTAVSDRHGVLAERAGIPAGVFNVVPSSSSLRRGQGILRKPRVRKLTFTGSTEVGRILLKQAAIRS